MPNWDEQNIIKLLGIESLPDARKIEIIEMTTDLVQKRLVLRILDGQTPEQQEEFGEVLDQNNQELLQDYIDKNVPDFETWLFEEVSKVKEELGKVVSEIDNSEN